MVQKHSLSRTGDGAPTKILIKEIKHILKGYRLLEATRLGPLHMVEALRSDQGVNLDLGVRDRANETVYHLVARRANDDADSGLGYELLKRFLLWDSNPRYLQMENVDNDTPLHSAVRENAPISIISLLVHNGASESITRENKKGETPKSLVENLADKSRREQIQK